MERYEFKELDLVDQIFDSSPNAEFKCYEEIVEKKRDVKADEKQLAALNKHIKKKEFRLNAQTLFLTFP